MTHKIIKTDNYLLVVDDNDNGNYGGYSVDIEIKSNPFMLSMLPDYNYRKVLAHLPLNNAPVLEGVDLLPESKVEILSALEFANLGFGSKTMFTEKELGNLQFKGTKVLELMEGYKASTKTYSEENLRTAIEKAILIGKSKILFESATICDHQNNIIKSLQQPAIPVEFKANFLSEVDAYYEDGIGYSHRIKRINNEQGIPVWQGEYVYKT